MLDTYTSRIGRLMSELSRVDSALHMADGDDYYSLLNRWYRLNTLIMRRDLRHEYKVSRDRLGDFINPRD